jgi:hypothetical protein
MQQKRGTGGLTMAEYIEREALIAEYDRVHIGPAGGARKLMVEAPPANVVEVRHGEWIEADSTRKGQKFVCSVCKGVSYYPQPTRSKNWVKHCGYSYCPHCIAKMDGKDGAE